jgi:hypothetical protein
MGPSKLIRLRWTGNVVHIRSAINEYGFNGGEKIMENG